MKRSLRGGFSMFDVLVVIAILAILIALLIPAIQKVREAATRATSQNNLKQLGIAVHNYHDVYGTLPSGNDPQNYSTVVFLLPFIEEANAYKQLSDASDTFKKPVDGKANDPSRKLAFKILLSPKDPLPFVKEGLGATNYLFCAGSKAARTGNNGIFGQPSDKPYSLANITDGTSNTLLIGETLKGDGGTKGVTVERQHVRLDKDALKNLKDETGAQDFKDSKNVVGNRCQSWMDGRFLQGVFTATRLANDDRPDVDCGFGGLSGLRSLEKTVNVAMADGSVRAVSVTISLKTWKLVADATDGNPLPEEW